MSLLLQSNVWSWETSGVFIDHGVEHQLRVLRNEGFPNETGGILLGYYDFNIGAAVVVAGLPASLIVKELRTRSNGAW
nr:hypothetical protein [Pseudomonas syringae]